MPESGRRRDQGTHPPDRRARRRAETRSQILDLAVAIMTEDGVAGLSMAGLARALSIQPPSLYKYFPSRMAVYDALFRQGQLANLEALLSGMRGAEPGMDAVAAGMEATGRWAVSHPVVAQVLAAGAGLPAHS
jgi:AcrR family transcriptional regulator